MHRIAGVAQHQRGRISRRQLLAIGITSSSIADLVAAGVLIRIHRGVYALAHLAPMQWADETAALLALRDGAVLSHQTAAQLWGLELPRHGDRRIHVTVPGSPGGRPRGVAVHRINALQRGDVRIRHGLPVTAPILTFIQLAPTLPTPTLQRAIQQALYLKILRDRDLDPLLAHAAGRAGAARLRTAAGTDTDGYTASRAEQRLRSLIRQAQLPTPRVNYRRGRYKPDFHWPELDVILELDDWGSHQTYTAFEGDRLRDSRHAAEGIGTSRTTPRQVTDEPFAVIARLAAQLALAAARRRR